MTVLTPDEIRDQVEAVREAVRAGDVELANVLEVNIWGDVLDEIASGAFDAQDLASAAISTTSIKFPRWRA